MEEARGQAPLDFGEHDKDVIIDTIRKNVLELALDAVQFTLGEETERVYGTVLGRGRTMHVNAALKMLGDAVTLDHGPAKGAKKPSLGPQTLVTLHPGRLLI